MGDFPAHTQLIVRFGEPNPHGFVLVPECGKTLSAIPHRLSIIYEKVVLYINPLIFVVVCGFNIKSSTIMVIHVFGIINFPKIFNETK